jgi:hypothetical protein
MMVLFSFIGLFIVTNAFSLPPSGFSTSKGPTARSTRSNGWATSAASPW